MEGLGQDKKDLATEQVPLPNSVDGILTAVRAILVKGQVYSIHIDKNQPITYTRASQELAELTPGDDADLSDLSPYDIARQGNLVEFDARLQGLEKESPVAQVAWMMAYVEKSRVLPTHILVAETTDFWAWLGIPAARGNKFSTFLGMRVERDSQMPSHAFLIFGNQDRLAAPYEAKIIVKGVCQGGRP